METVGLYGYQIVNFALVHFLEFLDKCSDIVCPVARCALDLRGGRILGGGRRFFGRRKTQRHPDDSRGPKHGKPPVAKNTAIFHRTHGGVIGQSG